jgi:DNA transformation protein
MDDIAEYMNDVFQSFGPIALRRMFSGRGVFREGVMFALFNQDTLYLKTDEQNLASFQKLGLQPFSYVRNGKTIALSYYQAPAIVMEDPAEAAAWANLSYQAALRSTRARKAKPKKV